MSQQQLHHQQAATRAAARVARTIGTFKWVLVAAALVAGVIGFAVGLTTEAGATIAFGSAAGAAVYAVSVWVLFGWFQHTLGMLAAISANTARG